MMFRRGKIRTFVSAVLVVVLIFTAVPLDAFAMQVKVKVTSENSQFTLEAEPTDRVEDLKVKIEEEQGFPVEGQVLTF
ncbi:MAG: hypothetical protein IIX84_06915, partial [Oscillospiraceae bacterium]|nr:hypothetical protein [Oscillospiraceae bacterium]